MVGVRCCSRLQDLYIPIVVILIVLLQDSVLIHKASANDVDFLLDSSLQDLLDIEVTTVSRRSENIMTAPAAIYVLTGDDLRRRGIVSLPEALRLVPGLFVASIDGNKWVVSSRGMAGRYTNKLLVQIDGRSVYIPSYSGVYWDMQDLFIADIDRIEVIRGPGATLWGANAVNGVINIITKSAEETQDGHFQVAAGNQLTGDVGLRYGGALGEESYGRVYIKGSRFQDNSLVAGGSAEDEWESSSIGFRLDGQYDTRNAWVLQGDVQENNGGEIISTLWQPAPVFIQQQVKDTFTSKAWNLLGRWEYLHSEGGRSTLQAYWDHTKRQESYLDQQHDTLDIDFQSELGFAEQHHFVYGFGYRKIWADYRNSYQIGIYPDSQTFELISGFAQAEFELLPDILELTIGSKVEHNDFTGTEVQPSLRFMWSPITGHSLWTSVARAVRTPSVIENSSEVISTTLPSLLILKGNDEMSAEILMAYELGYRYYSNPHFTLDLSLFYNDYDDYLSYSLVSPSEIQFQNRTQGQTHGFELATTWQARPWWQLKASYSLVHVNMQAEDSLFEASSETAVEGSAAENQLLIQSSMNLSDQWELDAWVRYMDQVHSPSSANPLSSIDDYVSLNARVSWKPSDSTTLSVTGNNLLESKHQEYEGEIFSSPTEIERSVFVQLQWQF